MYSYSERAERLARSFSEQPRWLDGRESPPTRLSPITDGSVIPGPLKKYAIAENWVRFMDGDELPHHRLVVQRRRWCIVMGYTQESPTKWRFQETFVVDLDIDEYQGDNFVNWKGGRYTMDLLTNNYDTVSEWVVSHFAKMAIARNADKIIDLEKSIAAHQQKIADCERRIADLR